MAAESGGRMISGETGRHLWKHPVCHKFGRNHILSWAVYKINMFFFTQEVQMAAKNSGKMSFSLVSQTCVQNGSIFLLIPH